MHGEPDGADALALAVARHAEGLPDVFCVVLCPPPTLLGRLSQLIAGVYNVKTGGQTCHHRDEGAFTGDVSARMVRDAGASYVIVGHSERRQYHNETNAQVKEAAALALNVGLIPIICIGESAQERTSGRAFEVVGAQVLASLPEEAKSHDFVLAYDPVWAIDSGATPTMDDIAVMHAHIMAVAAKKTGKEPSDIAVLYGGSVKADNAHDILHTLGVSGVLVGGASLKAEEFCRIISAAV